MTNLGDLPLYFEANLGQADVAVKFIARGLGHTVMLTPTEALFVLGRRAVGAPGSAPGADVVRMSFIGGDPSPPVVGAGPLPGNANYFIGSDPTKWRTGVPTYAKVHYRGVYPGVDVVFYPQQRRLEYDIVVQPGASADRVALRIDGAERLELDGDGDLLIRTASGTLRQRKPVVYQEIDGVRRPVASAYVVRGEREVAFKLGDYDRRLALVIDPVIVYTTYLGGNGDDAVGGSGRIVADAAGNAYIVSRTTSTDLPISTTIPPAPAGVPPGFAPPDLAITKLNAAGTQRLYTTYIGGNGDDLAFTIFVDGAGNAYVAGETTSTNFPVTALATQALNPDAASAFLTKLNATGTGLLYSTYLVGGVGTEAAKGIAVDAAGKIYVTGVTASSDFLDATAPSPFSACGPSGGNAFVAKLDPTIAGPSGRVYVRCLGADASGNGIAVDRAGNAYVAGRVAGTFPTPAGGVMTAVGNDAFVAKIDPTGAALLYTKLIGGSGSDLAESMALDAAGNVYIAGYTGSTNFPTTLGAFQSAPTSTTVEHAFVAKLDAAGTALVYSTYVRGTGRDIITDLKVDPAGQAYVAGFTTSTDFPITADALQSTHAGGAGQHDAFVTKLNSTGTGLVYSSYLGTTSDDVARSVAIDGGLVPNVYVKGYTNATNFPTTSGVVQPAYAGGIDDVFVMKLGFPIPTPVSEWRFDEMTGTVAPDAIDGNPGTLVGGASFVSGLIGNAVSVNGTGGRVHVADSSNLRITSRITVEALVYLTEPNASTKCSAIVVKWGGGGAGGYGLHLGPNGARPGFGISRDGNEDCATGAPVIAPFPLPLRQWHHLVGTYDGTVQRLYVNGALAAEGMRPGTINATTAPFTIGDYDPSVLGFGVPMAGRVDQVAVYDKALDAGMVAQLAEEALAVRAYVTNFGANPPTVSVIDHATGDSLGTVTVGSQPAGVGLSSDGTRAYISNYNASSVSVIDRKTNLVLHAVGVGVQPWGVAVSPDGTRVYVANQGSDTVSVIDPAVPSVVATVTVGDQPLGVAVSPDGTRVLVANQGANTVAVIDTTTSPPEVITNIPVGPSPIGVAFKPNTTRAYVSNQGSGDISILDAYAANGTIPLPAGANPWGLVVSPDGTRLYIADRGNARLVALDTTTHATVFSTPISSTPGAVAITPDGRHVYVTHYIDNTSPNLTVVDTASGAVVSTSTMGPFPVSFGQFVGPTASAAPTAVDVTIALAAAPSTVASGGNITYTVTVANNGPSTATGITWTTNLGSGRFNGVQIFPPATTCTAPQAGTSGVVTCTIAQLASGQSQAQTLFVLAPATGGPYALSTSVTSEVPEADGSNNSAAANVSVIVGGAISGTVKDPAGNPIPGAEILPHPDTSGNFVGATTEMGGAYAVSGLFPDTYRIQAKRPGYGTRWFDNKPTLQVADPVAVASGATAAGKDIVLTPGAGAISGTVRNAAGNGIPFASVCIDVASGGFVVCATTDGAGVYHTDFVLAQGSYKARASAEGFAARWNGNVLTFDAASALDVADGVLTSPVDFTLPTGYAISGRIVDALGNGIVGAQVEILDAVTGLFVESAGSTAGGDYSTARRIAPGTYKIKARATGFSPKYFDGRDTFATADAVEVVSADVSNRNLTLPAGGTITGQVTNGATGIVGATVKAHPTVPFGDFASTTTGAGGVFSLTGLAVGTYRLSAEAEGFALEWYDNQPTDQLAQFIAPGNPTAGITFALQSGAGGFSGQVTEATAPNGPIANANVCVHLAGGGFVGCFATDNAGVFTTGKRLAPGTYKAQASATGRVALWNGGALTSNSAPAITVNPDTVAPTNVTFALPIGRTVSGRITNQSQPGTGVAGARVELNDSATGNFVVSADTDGDGNYSLASRVPNGTYKVTISADGFFTEFHDNKTTFGGGDAFSVTSDTVLNAALAPGGTISGNVQGPSGDLASVTVQAEPVTIGGTFRSAQTDGSGNYTINRLALGNYRLRAEADGVAIEWYDNVPHQQRATQVAAGDLTAKNFVLSGPVGGFRGMVVDTAVPANPIVNANVCINFATGTAFVTCVRTDSTGQFRTGLRLTPGAYRAQASGGGLASMWNGGTRSFSAAPPILVSAGVETMNVNFALPVPRAIKGKVTRIDGTAIGSARVEIYDATLFDALVNPGIGADQPCTVGRLPCFVTADATTGEYATGPVFAPGTYKAKACGPGSAAGCSANGGFIHTFHGGGIDFASATPVTVPANADAAGIDIALETGGRISGTLRARTLDGTAGAGIAGNVSLQRLASSTFYGVFSRATNADGTFTFTGLHDGEYLLVATASTRVVGWYSGETNNPATDFSTATPIVIAGGNIVTGIDVGLRMGGGTITGRITRHDNGQPIRANTLVNIRGPWPRTSSIGVTASTNAEGVYTATGLPAGQYVIEANPVQTPDGTAIGFYPFGATSRGTGLPVTVTEGATTSGIDFQVRGFSGGESPRVISGTLRSDPGAAPVTSAFVFVSELRSQSLMRVGTANADGTFVVNGLAPGVHSVTANTARGFVTTSLGDEKLLGAWASVDVVEGDSGGHTITLPINPGLMSGRVIRADTGVPIPGATVSLRNFADTNVLAGGLGAAARPDGTWLARGLPPGQYKVRVTAPGFRTRYYQAPADAPTGHVFESGDLVLVNAGQERTNIDIALEPAVGEIRGKLVLSQSDVPPVSGASVQVRDAVTGSTVTTVSTVADGSFAVTGLAPGNYKVRFSSGDGIFAVTWYHSGGAQRSLGSAGLVPVGAGVNDLGTIALSTLRGTINGIVFHSNGTTRLADASVVILDRANGTLVTGAAVTGKGGTFTALGVPPASAPDAYIAQARALGFASEFFSETTVQGSAATISVTAGFASTGVNFTLDGPPAAFEQTVTTLEDTPQPLVLNGHSGDGGTPVFSIVAGPSSGTLSGAPPVLTYTPAPHFNGSDSLQFTLSDGTTTTAPATVGIVVTPVNDPPVFDAIASQSVPVGAGAQAVTITGVAPGPAGATDEAAQTVTLTATSSDPLLVPNPTIAGSGGSRTLTYVSPAAPATITITVTANDGQPVNNTFVRTFIITAGTGGVPNAAPVALGNTVSTSKASPVTILLSGTDAETVPSQLTYTVASPPGNGTLTGTGRTLTYTPAATFTGTDSFTFTVTDRGNPDGCGAPSATCGAARTSAAATVAIVVNAAESTIAAASTTLITAPPLGALAGGSQLLGDIAINETYTGSLTAGASITVTLPPGLTFDTTAGAKPLVAALVGNGLALALQGDTPGTIDGGTFSFAVAQPSTTGPARLLISGISVIVAPGFLGTAQSAPVVVTVGGTNPGIAITPVVTATAVLQGGAPALEAISPPGAARGVQGWLLTLTGKNFAAPATVTVGGVGVTVGPATVDSAEQIRVAISVAANAADGQRDVTVTQTAGSSTLAQALTIAPPPSISGTDHDAANPLRRGPSTQRVNVSGAGFQNPTISPPNLFIEFGSGTPFVPDPRIVVERVGFEAGGRIWADVTVLFDAALGGRSVRVVNPDGGIGVSAVGAVDVQEPTPGSEPTLNAPPSKTTTSAPPLPSIAGLTPAAALLGAPITISGGNFSTTPASNSVTFAAANNTRVPAPVTAVTGSGTQMSLTVNVPSQAVDGNVTIAVSGQVSNAAAFTVTSPRLSSVVPSSGEQGTPLQVELTGSKFVQGATVRIVTADGLEAPGVTVDAVDLVTGTSILATVTLDATALGVFDVVVTNPTPGGGTAVLPGGFEVRPRSEVVISLAGVDTRAYLPSVGAVNVTLDGTGRCTSKLVAGVPVGITATFKPESQIPAAVRFVIESSAIPGTATNEDCELGPPAPDFTIGVDGNPDAFRDETVVNGTATTVLYARDMGGTVTVRVIDPVNGRELGVLRLPVDSDSDGLPDAWEQAVQLNGTSADEDGNGVPDDRDKFARDGLTNFEKYRGVFLAGPARATGGVFTGHERLDPRWRHLFVRGRGFGDDPMMLPGTCGWDIVNNRAVTDQTLSATNPCPRFEVGTAFEGQGIRVMNATASFTAGRELTRVSMVDPTMPTLDMVTVTYDAVNCNSSEACDQTTKAGIRQWGFSTLGASTYGSASAYGIPRLFKRAVESYFRNKPYEHRTNDPTRVVLAPDGRPMLAPITLVGDGNDNGTVDRREGIVDGVLAGDTYIVGAFNRELSALDVNNDGCVELPNVPDPTAVADCDPTAGSGSGAQATKQQVVRHVITHEIGHAVGVTLHTAETEDVMYQYSINWTRDNVFGPTAAGLIQIHNKRQQ